MRHLLEEEFLEFFAKVMGHYTNHRLVQGTRWLGVIMMNREDHMKPNLLVHVYKTSGAVNPGMCCDYSGEMKHCRGSHYASPPWSVKEGSN